MMAPSPGGPDTLMGDLNAVPAEGFSWGAETLREMNQPVGGRALPLGFLLPSALYHSVCSYK